MKLAQFKTKASEDARLGLLNNDVIVDITDIAATTKDFIVKGAAAIHPGADHDSAPGWYPATYTELGIDSVGGGRR